MPLKLHAPLGAAPLSECAGIALHLAQAAMQLPEETWDDPQMNLFDGTLSVQEVMGRIRSHPLFSTRVSMRDRT